MEKWEWIHHRFQGERGKEKQLEWQALGFDYQETKEWIATGLNPRDYELAHYLKAEGRSPQKLAPKYQELRTESGSLKAQGWLDYFYPWEKRTKIRDLSLVSMKLEGSLNLTNFSDLEDLKVNHNKITSLCLSYSLKLKDLRCRDNFINNLDVKNLTSLERLQCSNNQINNTDFLNDLPCPEKLIELKITNNKFPPQDLNFLSKFSNLEGLYLGNNPFFGSLKPLKNLVELSYLNIQGTDIDGGLEYLSKNVEMISDWANKKTAIVERELSTYGQKSSFDNLLNHNVQNWRRDQLGFKELQEILIQINPSLDIQKVIEQFHFFNVKNGFFEGNLEDLKLIFRFAVKRTESLKAIIKNLWAKILEAYCRLAPESDLLEELINAELTYRKAKEQNFDSIDLRKKRDNIYNQLEEKFSREQMEEVEFILTDCEKLIINELELEAVIVIEEAGFRMIININEKIEAQGDIIIGNGNIINSYKQLENGKDYQKVANLSEMMEKVSLTSTSCYYDNVNNSGNLVIGSIIRDPAQLENSQTTLTEAKVSVDLTNNFNHSTINNSGSHNYFGNEIKVEAKIETNSKNKSIVEVMKKNEAGTRASGAININGAINNHSGSNSYIGNKNFEINHYQNSNPTTSRNPLSSVENNNQIINSNLSIGKLIGRGGYGKVYLGYWNNQTIAVKELPNIKGIDKEINLLKRLRNPNIIGYYDECQKDNNVYLVMEYAEQGSLANFIKKNKTNPHNWSLNYKLISQITNGLKYLHSEGIIHRDLKSPNVLITKEYDAKLADFGLAKLIDESSSGGQKPKGTLRWLAPEVLGGGNHSFQSDIYSLGVVMWEIVAQNTLPFSNFRDNATVMFNVVNDNLRETIPNDTPDKLKEIIEGCREANLEQRISLSEIENKLNSLKSRAEDRDFVQETQIQSDNSEIEQEEILERNNKNKGKSKTIDSIESSLNSSQSKIIQLQSQLRISKENGLKSIIGSLKAKLKSTSKFSNDRQKREEKLNTLFEDLPNNPSQFNNYLEAVKTDLSKKLTEEEVNQLYQIKQELVEATEQLQNQIEVSTNS